MKKISTLLCLGPAVLSANLCAAEPGLPVNARDDPVTAAFAPVALARAEDTAGRTFQSVADPNTGWLTSIRRAEDPTHLEFIRPGQSLGPVKLRVRTPGTPWREVGQSGAGVEVGSRFRPAGEALRWDVTVKNTGAVPLELGDLALPLPMNADYTWNHEETLVHRVFKHAFIAGHGSFLYWLPVKGTGSFLVMQPMDGASLEFFTATDVDYAQGKGQFAVFIHSKAAAELDKRGTWRQPRTSRILKAGEDVTYSFVFCFADNYEGVRELVYRNGGVDVHVAPGMTVPRDLSATIALRTKLKIEKIEAEFPKDATIEPIGQRGEHTQLYRIKFTRLGENLLTVRYGVGRALPLEFFVTEPLETLVKKRAAFIVKNQQHRDPAKWYDGLYSLWDRNQPAGGNLLGPDHLGGQHPYAVSGSDDPSNGKSLLVAEKNVAFPEAAEIASLEYFIKHFVWGKHQRTDTETPYPYGIYGSDSWQQNRFTDRDPLDKGISRPGGPSACRMWRTFDYTTYFALYFNLYRIAKQRPELVKEGSAAEYLERAYGTARAYFEVPANIHMEGGWSFTGWVDWQYTQGNFHEKYLLPLIAALEAEGQQAKADFLRAEWEKKVKYFIYDTPWPFASEMPIDSTAYESTYAAAKYALEVPQSADTNLWQNRNSKQWYSHPVIDPKRHEAFLMRQHFANLACRGVLEANYWSLGSDFRGCGSASYTLSYMSQMGGWAVLDYALRFDPNPAANLRLGYASMLSSWALVNSGDAASNYGCWTPGALHDGAMGWGFQPRQVGTEWNPATRDLPRGAWPVCGEADHGLVAGIEAACTVLFDDPLFGLIAFGGEVTQTNQAIAVIPRDGVRQRFSAVLGARRLHLALDRDGFAAGQPLRLTPTLDRFAFMLESRAPAPHAVTLTIEGLPPGRYSAAVGAVVRPFRVEEGRMARIELPLASNQPASVQIEPAAGRAILIEGETPDRQFGSLGKGSVLSAASGGNVLSQEWGAATGHFAEYCFEAKKSFAPARIEVRYARAFAGDGYLQVALDGKALGTVVYHSTGGWGDNPSHYRTADLIVGPIESGTHTLRLTVVAGPGVSDTNVLAAVRPAPAPMLDLIGNRADKNTVGHGNNVALYTGRPSKFFFATHELGNIFSAADGATVNWYPDHVLVEPGHSAQAAPNVNIDKIEISQVEDAIPPAGRSSPKDGQITEVRQVCVTKDDVVVSRITLYNPTGQPLAHTIEVTGDCRGSFDWREGPGGVKNTLRMGNIVLLEDRGVFPAVLSNGLCMAIGGNLEPAGVDTAEAGTYRITYQIQVPGNATKSLTLACAINRDQKRALECLGQALKQEDPIATNRQDWQAFYEREIPQFSCSDRGLMELYGLRWFLLKFSTAGGDLGFFKYPVVMEGREAYQTYCCYSAPFMAYDMNWCVDPQKGFGHIANMTEIAYEDGRFPFYTSPRTNRVLLHHESATGQSALQDTMWKHYLIHGDKRMLQQVYPAMKKNMQWWIKDRDADGNGLFVIKDQLECMDDVYRWGHENRKEPYESLTANSTTYINLRSIARIARVLGNRQDADYFDAYADKTRNAVNSLLWDKERKAWFDRRLGSGQLATHYPIISMFYPFYAGIGGAAQMDVFRDHLLNPQEFWLPYPIPALPRNHPAFGPEKFWEGPSWPASTSHVVEGFSSAAKKYDRSLLPKAAELFRRATSLHLQPRADFYERYNPLTGNGLSRFRDYMHSWWIDLIIRDAVGLIINDDGSITIDPLPIGMDDFALQGVPVRGQRIDITWREPDKAREDKNFAPGLTVKCNGKTILEDPKFRPGGEPKHIQSPVLISGF